MIRRPSENAMELLYGYGSDVGICSLIPVKETFYVNNLSCLKVAYKIIELLVTAVEIVLKAEAVLSTVLGKGNIDVISGLVVLECNGNNSHIGENNLLVLVIDELIGSELIGKVLGCCYEKISVINELESSINDLGLSCPLALEAVNSDLGSLGKLCCIFLGASKLIKENSAVLILAVNGDLVVPP